METQQSDRESAQPWDSGETVSPDPSWPIEARLHWYEVASHMLLLNCSEVTRRKAAAAADREAAPLAIGNGERPAVYARFLRTSYPALADRDVADAWRSASPDEAAFWRELEALAKDRSGR